MTEQRDSPRKMSRLIIAAALVVIIAGINHAQTVLASFLAAVFLAMLGTPPVFWLKRKRIPSFFAVTLVLSGMITILVAVCALVGASFNNFYSELPTFQIRIEKLLAELQPILEAKGIHDIDTVLLGYINPAALMNLTTRLLTGVGTALADMLLIFLTVGFILFEASNFPVKLRAVLGDPQQTFPQFTKFYWDIERYMLIKTLVSVATGLLIGLWLTILGVDFPILWGFLAFLLNYVPSVGSTVAAIPAVLLALVQLGRGSALLAAAGYMVINVVLDNVIETKLMGRKLGLSTLVVFLSLVFWGSLLGPVGMVLCIPLTMTLKFACENNQDTRWIAILLGPEVPEISETPPEEENI